MKLSDKPSLMKNLRFATSFISLKLGTTMLMLNDFAFLFPDSLDFLWKIQHRDVTYCVYFDCFACFCLCYGFCFVQTCNFLLCYT